MNDNSVCLTAKITHGLGVAHQTLVRQLPLIACTFPEVSACFCGTLNAAFDCDVILLETDHTTPPLAWTPSGRTKEQFSFVRIRLSIPNTPYQDVPAWIYVAHLSPHRKHHNVHEIITQALPLEGVEQVEIVFPTASQIQIQAFAAT